MVEHSVADDRELVTKALARVVTPEANPEIFLADVLVHAIQRLCRSDREWLLAAARSGDPEVRKQITESVASFERGRQQFWLCPECGRHVPEPEVCNCGSAPPFSGEELLRAAGVRVWAIQGCDPHGLGEKQAAPWLEAACLDRSAAEQELRRQQAKGNARLEFSLYETDLLNLMRGARPRKRALLRSLLREREISGSGPSGTSSAALGALLDKAIELAEKAHAGQVDKAGKPYIGHCRRVMDSLHDPVARIVGILHDAVEDSSLSLQELAALGFPATVTDALDAITKRHGEPYEDYLARVRSNRIALTVKVADMTDNMDIGRIESPSAEDFERLEKYRRTLPMLKEWL